MSELAWQSVTVGDGAHKILDGVSLRLCAGELVALIGPNGAGKTTLLRAGLGLLAFDGGTIRLDGTDPRAMAASERARRIAYLPQSRPLAWPLTVEGVVTLGRFAYGGPLRRPSGADAAAIGEALAACRLEPLARRSVETLSGGELARVHVARALAAQAPLLLADEPTSALDPLHAFETMAILKAYCARGGGALVTLHDLSLAARFADRIVLLQQGRIVADASPASVLTPPILAKAFGVRAALADGHVRIDGPA